VETIETPRVGRQSALVRRARRIVGNVLLLLGIGILLWTFVVWRWNDPFTSLYTRWQQHKLVATHALIVEQYAPKHAMPASATPRQEAAAIARQARRLRAGAETGAPIGRIIVPRLHLNMLFVNGTDHESLKRGPGRDERTYMPGQGELVYIAGHRTTYLAPFSAIDKMRPGDRITLSMPYGTFLYVVTGHRIVDGDDLSVLKSTGREMVALQACHPRFFATHRYIIWAKPVTVKPVNGRPYRPAN
jgi:sortase A